MTNENETTTEDAVETQAPPTLDEVRREESKARELRERVDEIGPEVESYESEIAEALADGDEESARRLRTARRELIELRADLEAATEVLEARARQRRETATRELARKRLAAIEDESVVGASLLDEDVARLLEAAHTFAEVAKEIEDRYAGLMTLDAEADALCDRFRDLDPPEVPTVLPPGRTDTVKAARKTVSKVTIPARTPRRVDLAGTEAGKIISEAGEVRPDFVLSEEELAERREAEERERVAAERKAEEEARVEAELSRFGAGTGSRTG